MDRNKDFVTGFTMCTIAEFKGRQLWQPISPVIFNQFWKVRTVLKSSEPEFFRTLIGKAKSPKNIVVIAIFPNW